MTAPTKSQRADERPTPDSATAPAADRATGTHTGTHTDTDTHTGPAGDPDTELRDLVRTQDDVTSQARRIVAGRVVAEAGDSPAAEGERTDRLVAATRADLLAELRGQEQEEARRQLAEAGRSGEDAAAAVVRGATAIVRSVVPAALVRPEDLVEAAYGLADQALRVTRRLALSVTAGLRDLGSAA
ncbi:hypothetical protein SAMN05660657_01162 [Geodermatophilus amargosae]|uniref:Uncharacterized protein n=1 Tax=Geodermatophilus amargosae TaxID=1296565 RepID=A0A1I6YKW0_9ACTN|nr:hypothetical protein [Geodermatophilus amargosae]SFT50851.1 hypothetical protein SAMN05660657_01162 [Geodermatophilus amargosae]